jgi:hypothetical protein
MARLWFVGWGAAGLVFLSLSAWADEQMRVLAASGDWVAMAHHASLVAPPDVCLVVNSNGSAAIRADTFSREFRVMDNRWSLPSDVQGTISISVGDWKNTLDIVHNTSTVVSALLPDLALGALFIAMDKASNMTVKVGNEAPRNVSLVGSTIATNAFRTCAGIRGNGSVEGSNPFR